MTSIRYLYYYSFDYVTGAFLIPYFVMLAIEGIPIFYLELAVGQRLRKGAIGVWSEVSPYLAGIGISSAVVSFNVALYYNTIIAWCLFYFVQVIIFLIFFFYLNASLFIYSTSVTVTVTV